MTGAIELSDHEFDAVAGGNALAEKAYGIKNASVSAEYNKSKKTTYRPPSSYRPDYGPQPGESRTPFPFG